jgi:DNA polymerase-3 subunit alpha
LRVLFLEGAAERGYEKPLAEKVYDEMAFFAEYGFNKSHSASYAVLSIQTAWLKAHHPAEFMAATMTTEMNKSDRVTQLIDEVKCLGLVINPPDVNNPSSEFDVRDGEIIFGMGAVKNVGAKAIEEIAAVRGRRDADFSDLFEFCEEVDLSAVNRKVVESLIHAGAMDALGGHRRQKIVTLDRAVQYGNRVAREKASGQVSLFGAAAEASVKPVMDECSPHDPLDELSFERASLGFFLSGHPFHEYREFMASLPVSSTRRAARLGDGAWVELAGVVTSFTEARDRNKRLYARTHFEDRRGLIELTVYSSLYETAAEHIKSDSILVIGGRVRVKADNVREIVADRVSTVDEALRDWTGEVLLGIDLDGAGVQAITALEALVREDVAVPVGDPAEDGSVRTVPLLVEVVRGGKHWLLRSRSRRVSLSLTTLRRMRDLPGVESIRIRCGLPAPAPQKRNGGFRKRTAGG